MSEAIISGAAGVLDFAFLCDLAAGMDGGKLQARGIGVDTFVASAVPSTLPLLLVARFSGFRAPAQVTLRVVDADRQPVMERCLLLTMVDTAPGRPSKSPLLLELRVPTRAAGDYQLEMLVDGDLVHVIPYWVVMADAE